MPVLGQAVARRTDIGAGAPVVVSVHGVRRISGGTVIYWSFGSPAGSAPADTINAATALGHTTLNYAAKAQNPDVFSNIAIIDQKNLTVYGGLLTPAGRCVCSAGLATAHMRDGAGKAWAMYGVVPELPADTTVVDVSVGDQVFVGIPVQDGAMTPESDPAQPIVLGTSWPKVDQTALSAVTDRAQSTYPLIQQVADLAGSVTTRKRSKTTSVDLASDVLFDSDKATLSTKAASAIREGASQIKAAGATGSVTITGYTDSTNTAAYNVDLSRRRAAAVAAALRPLLPTSITFTVAGRGEADPIASNETNDGRALNRRVSVSFTPGSAK